MTEHGHDHEAQKTTPIASAEETAHIDQSAVEKTNAALAVEAEKSGTNVDTLVGRMVVEQNLATPEEVQHCLTIKQSAEELNSRSLTQLLIDNAYVTERQLKRLRSMIEAERSGQRIPGFKILGKLGAGAMATVYKAKQISLDRTVAVKVLPRKFSKNVSFIERFYAEGRAAAQLNHPNIVQAFDVGNEKETYFFVMEYVDGRTVHDDITENKRYSEADAIDVVIQVAEALEHAHERGLVHRDVKPKNIMISRQGPVKLADMGLARAMSDKEAAEAESGKAFGTPYYISPEQIRGEKNIGPQADIYSLGATLYHMVTGTVPFEGKDPASVMRKHLRAPLQPPDHVNPKLSPHISEVIEMMMAKGPKDRYASCKDLLVDLRAVQDGEQPPIAHRGLIGEDQLAEIIEAEAQAPSEIAVDATDTESGGVFTEPLFIALLVVLAVSVIGNILLIAL